MDDYIDWQDLPQLDYTPVHPPREGHIREQVFAERWNKLMGDDGSSLMPGPNERFASVLSGLTWAISPRSAKVASSFITWLGTNIGYAFLSQAENLHEKRKLVKRDAYLAAWAMQNVRLSFVNSGRRTLESILTSDADWEKTHQVAPVSSTDLEVAEHMALWLSEDDGQRFLQECHAEIERQVQEEKGLKTRSILY